MSFEISSFKRIVVLTGAGISAESGIGTFRDSGGLWEKHRIEDVATPEAFERNPTLVWRFYSMRRQAAAAARPNAAHTALAHLSSQFGSSGKSFSLVTQNVDTLHERALCATAPTSAAAPLTMHGTLSRSRCLSCGEVYADPWVWFDDSGKPISAYCEALAIGLETAPQLDATRVERDRDHLPLSPCCKKPIRPHIVWFGEMPLLMNEIMDAVSNCDLFVTIGTSGQVYPAAGFLEEAKFAGAYTVCLNMEALPQRKMVDLFIEGPASQTVPDFFHALLS